MALMFQFSHQAAKMRKSTESVSFHYRRRVEFGRHSHSGGFLVASRDAVSFLIFDNVNPKHHKISKQLSLTGSGVSRSLIMTVCHCSLQHSQRYDKFSVRSKTAKSIARYKTKKLTKQSNKHQKVLKPTLKSVKNPKKSKRLCSTLTKTSSMVTTNATLLSQ